MNWWIFHKHDWRVDVNPIVAGTRWVVHQRTDETGWFFQRTDAGTGMYHRRLICAVRGCTKWENKLPDLTNLPKADS